MSNRFRDKILFFKADDAGVLTPGKNDNDVWHKSDRKDLKGFYAMIVSGRTGSEAAG